MKKFIKKIKNTGVFDVTCPDCKYQNAVSSKFCEKCGRKFSESNPLPVRPIAVTKNNSFEMRKTVSPLPVYNSYFDGGLLQLIGWRVLGFLVTVFTFGICYPWACCMVYRWETKHMVIERKRLNFNGTAAQLFGKWILWWLAIIFTLGIFLFCLPIILKKWKMKHTTFLQRN